MYNTAPWEPNVTQTLSVFVASEINFIFCSKDLNGDFKFIAISYNSSSLNFIKSASIYGGNNDLWGTIWLPSDINLGNFGAVISASGTWNSVDVYSIEISVTYSIPCVSPAAPIIGTITQPTCTVPTGSVVLSGLPSGGWELTQNPGNVKINGSGANPTIPDLSPNTYTYSVVKNGLKAEYFNNMTFSGTPALTRTDATVNFNWVNLGPGGPIGNDYFSVRWSGQIQPLVTEDYNFRTRSDDGIRLWVNGVKIIDNWSNYDDQRS